MTMITIKTNTVKECGDYDKMCTTVEIEGNSVIIKEEIKTLLQYCKKDARLRGVVICAIQEVLHDN
jgi:hypothetical protein